jgi:hypothetical protein
MSDGAGFELMVANGSKSDSNMANSGNETIVQLKLAVPGACNAATIAKADGSLRDQCVL